MKTFIRFIMVLALTTTAVPAPAGELDKTTAPTAGSGLPTLSDIYNRLATGAAISIPGTFQEPSAGPTAGTGRSLADIQGVLPPEAGAANAADVGDVLSPKTFWGLGAAGAWGLQTGTVTAGGNFSGANGLLVIPIPDGLYSGGKSATAADGNLAAGNIKSGTAIFGVSGTVIQATGTAVAGNVLNGTTFSNSGAAGISGTMPDRGVASFTPGAAAVPVPAGYYSGGQVNTDANLVSGNIRSGVSIFGVTGTLAGYTCSGTMNGTRWCDNGNGTVRDMTTGLIWLKDASWGGSYPWYANSGTATVFDMVSTLANGAVLPGIPSTLTDGSVAGDWRMPTKAELVALTSGTEAVLSGTPRAFSAVQGDAYWSSSSNGTYYAWGVDMSYGHVGFGNKSSIIYVWPVRGGQ